MFQYVTVVGGKLLHCLDTRTDRQTDILISKTTPCIRIVMSGYLRQKVVDMRILVVSLLADYHHKLILNFLLSI